LKFIVVLYSININVDMVLIINLVMMMMMFYICAEFIKVINIQEITVYV